jgi:HD-like signal output (HDOD) protein/CheY-like chemotaxis protein
MKKRILFVDDEPMVLQGLQRLLRPMRGEWDMEFVADGANALRVMERQPCDVIVTDMRMPGMNGAELLAEVMRKHPATVRLVLSGYADQDLVLKCVGSTHQYLSKPCDPEALKTTIARASNLDDSLQSERLKKLVCQLSHLPSIPSLYMEIVEKASEPSTTLHDIGGIISKDIVMTAQILKLANSAFFGLRRQLANPEMAATYIGLDTIKSLILSIHAFSQFKGVNTGSLQMETLWNHSLRVASHAKAIAQAEGADSKVADEAFAAGMMHDIGKLILAVNLPGEFENVWKWAEADKLEFQDAEQRVFGANHADVGGYLIGLWGLPVPVVEAVALHHCPSRAPVREFSPLTCVHAANAFAGEGSAKKGGAAPAPMDLTYITRIGLLPHVTVWRESPCAA